MLLEFGVHYKWNGPDGGGDIGPTEHEATKPWLVLANMIIAAGECPKGRSADGMFTELTLRSGSTVDVVEPIEDVLDALSYVTRHISVTPGVVDKVDGEREEMYPWRRREKVTELAKKWRAHRETLAKGSAPKSGGAFSVPFGTMPAAVPTLTREGVQKVTAVEVERSASKVVVTAPGSQAAEAFARSDAETSTPRPTSTLPKANSDEEAEPCPATP